MCLILFAYRQHPDFPLVVAANRDEFYGRPADPLGRWQDHPQVIAGRDLEAGGTWLGVTDSGRFAAVTNFAEPPPATTPPKSRGELTERFLSGQETATSFVAGLSGSVYRGFNLLVFDGQELVYTSNRTDSLHQEFPAGCRLQPGVYGLANAALGASWPKVKRGTTALSKQLAQPTLDGLISVLHDDDQPPDSELPDRGNDLDLERRVAPCFIRGDTYGTRACTAVLLGNEQVHAAEQCYTENGVRGGRSDLVVTLNDPAAAAS